MSSGDRPYESPIEGWLERLYGRTRGREARDPARMRALLERLELGLPPRWIHVVGTNGKGSVAARIDAGWRAAGARPLRFLSPHVERFHERISVDGEAVRDDEIRAFLTRAWHDEPEPSSAFFELTLALALSVGAARSADAAVIEAGVGAARDATAALPDAEVVVVTQIAEDHLDQLGPTLDDVARDKGAAIVPGRPVVTGARGASLEVLREIAERRQATLHVLGDGGALFGWPDVVTGPPPGVAGDSARLAIAALRLLAFDPAGTERALAAAAHAPDLPARRERFTLDHGRTVWLDGAHNPSAAHDLAREVPSDAHVLLGVAARKDVARIRAAFGAAPRMILTAAVPGERPWGDDPAFEPDAERALAIALAGLPAGGTLVVTGSFHLAGRLRPVLRAEAIADSPGYGQRS